MLNKIISFSVRNKLVVGLFVLALVCWGAYEVTRLPIDAVPDITDNQVQVLTVSPSLGAPDVERLISFPVEQACSNIPGLKQIRSFSRFGLSLVTLVFTDETDLYWARQQVNERLQQVTRDLPQGIGAPELAPVSTGLGEIYQYVVRPKPGYEDRYDAMQLRTLQDWTVRRQLMGTPGVAEVSSFGGRLKQYEIAVTPGRLKAAGITIAEVFDALERNNENTGGAYIEKGPTVLYIRSEGLTRSLDDIRKIVVKRLPDGMPLLVRDVAEVRYGSAIRYGAMTYNDKGEVAGAVVMMLKGENASQVVKRVKEKIAEIQKSLPEGVVIEPFLDRTKMVDNAISTVEHNLLEGALIVVFVLVFFLGNLRAGLIVSSVIPLSMLFAIILMNMFGVGGNLMSLGAIDFGLIVDGSVIVVEAILHRFSHSHHFRGTERLDQVQMDKEVEHSTSGTIKSAVFSQIIILIVYFPILSLQGIEGKMFKPMAWTIAFAILGAFLLSITYVPMMNALFLNKKLRHKPTLADKMSIWLERKYQPLLKKVMRYPKTIIAVTLSLLAAAILLLGSLGGEFIPQIEEGDFAVETRLLTGSNLNNTIKYTQQASAILLQQFPEVTKVVTKIGSAEIPTDPMPFEAGDMMVILKPKNEWTSARSFPELSEKMTKALNAVPGITVGFQFPVQMRFNELMTGARQDVVCKIFGENLDSLAAYAHRLNGIIQTVPGAINIYEETVTGMPQVVIRYDRDAMARYGLNVQDVNRAVNAGFAGQAAGQVFEGEKRFDLVVRLDNDARQNLEDVRNLLIPAPGGVQIPVSEVAQIEEVEGVNQIQRENTRRRIVIGFNVSGRDVQSIVTELQQKVQQQLKLPADYKLVYGGSFENMNAAKERLSIVVPVALLMIFLLLYFAFNSVKQGLLIYTAIPLSAIGGILALWLRDLPFSISAGVGFIALFGVAVLNGILLVTEFNRLKKMGWTDEDRIVIHATKSKLRAVLMTALVPSLGFIPMAVSTGAGGAVQKPLATVVIGGLIVSTLLTLFVLPVFYILFERGFGFFRKPRKVAVLLVLLGTLGTAGYAQQRVTLQQAITLQQQHNLSLKAYRLAETHQQQLSRTAFDPDKMLVAAEYGQLNSAAKDTRFAISQSFQFPTVYMQQKKLLRANEVYAGKQTLNQAGELRTELKRVFYQLLLLEERKQVLQHADSIYIRFADKALNRFKAGDADRLESGTATSQRMQIYLQLQELLAEEEACRLKLAYLTGTDSVLVPAADSIVYYNSAFLPDSTVSGSPQLQLQQAGRLQSETAYRLEKQKLLPALTLGYANMSLRGWQTLPDRSDVFYAPADRFQSVSLGIGIPLFWGAGAARIKAAKTNLRFREQELEDTRSRLGAELGAALARYRYQVGRVQASRQVLLANAQMIIATAGNRLDAGEINYLDWVILVNQAFGIQAQYYDAVQQLNEATFEIERLKGTN
ncbi:CusA/CzcA family heavy metal efflux RND transporter [Taibaiella chishuiensis]|uniref:Cobalt-zinc-cadmium resistance protein CzcA n=1 Tax=Taibaiella chishuiensis TaxID=1434707 RepID=A0A2P8D1T4_9BACT|nr:CusA/CzcA family heavy metal efflux RND transporter [Taibaiella chishuiensis]PSK91172.1 cobalt-zinc-cadmium resistance protein CzcA [Taibaiella chishuiensis]